jgi:hypothetical protein
VISATLPSTLPIDGGFQDLRLAHLEDVAGVLARRDGPTDRKSLLALWGGGPESEAESGRFHGRRVTKVGPEVKHGPEGATLRTSSAIRIRSFKPERLDPRLFDALDPVPFRR